MFVLFSLRSSRAFIYRMSFPFVFFFTLLFLFQVFAAPAPAKPITIQDIERLDFLRAPKLHFFVPINEGGAKLDFCRSMMTALIHGYEPTIFNWHRTGTGYELQLAKVDGMKDILENYLKNVDDNDLVFMADGMDVWFQQSSPALIRRWNELGGGIVLGADKKCWPNSFDSPGCKDVPPSPLPSGLFTPHGNGSEPWYKDHYPVGNRPRWANSGTILGRVGQMRELFRDLTVAMNDPKHKYMSDQGVFNDYLAERRLTLDYKFRLFYANAFDSHNIVYHQTPNHPDPTAPFDQNIPWSEYPSLMHHKVTGELPITVHFNDSKQKKLLHELWGEPWYSQSRFRDLVKRRLEGKTLSILMNAAEGKDYEVVQRPFQEMCPMLEVFE